MSLSCTISEIGLLSIIFKNLKRSYYRYHAHLKDSLSVRRLIVHMDNQCTKFEVSSLSHYRNILGGCKILVGSRDVTTPLSRTLSVIHRLGLAMINSHIHVLRRYTRNINKKAELMQRFPRDALYYDRTIRQYAHGLLLESPFVPSSTDHWAVRTK